MDRERIAKVHHALVVYCDLNEYFMFFSKDYESYVMK